MKRGLLLLMVGLACSLVQAQIDRIVIPAGTPEDQALQEISKEQDAQKKLSLYQDFVAKFAANPAAVAYGNWQISQQYQTSNDFAKALEFGDKALASSPRNLDILVSQANIAQQMKDGAKTFQYCATGGEIFNSIAKQAKPADMNDADFAARLDDERNSAKSSYEFMEAAAYNVIASENDNKARMAYIERYATAFPKSRFEEQVTSYAVMSLSDSKDQARLLAFGERTLAANPNSVPALLLLANSYADDTKPGSLTKAATYSQKAIEISKADAPDADRSRKLSGGVAHSTLGYVYMKQDKTAASIPELKTASSLLKGEDEQQYAIALYRLGFAYGKLNKMAEAREVLMEAVKITGPVQQPAQDLLAKVSAAKTKAK